MSQAQLLNLLEKTKSIPLTMSKSPDISNFNKTLKLQYKDLDKTNTDVRALICKEVARKTLAATVFAHVQTKARERENAIRASKPILMDPKLNIISPTYSSTEDFFI